MMVNTNLRLGGLATGMDTELIVQNMMKIARMPLDKKVRTRQYLQWKQEDYRNMNLRLLALKNKAFDMRLSSVYKTKKVSSANQGIVTASAVSQAATVTYNLKVSQLAEAARNMTSGALSADPVNKISTSSSLLSQAEKFAAPGTFFEGKTETDTFTVTVRYAADKTKDFTFSYADSLDKVIQTINNDKEAGITLFYDEGTTQDKLVITSKATGADAILEVSGDFFNTVLGIDNAAKVAGKDAVFELNGLVTQRSNNTFTVNGVTFTLTGETPGGLSGAATTVTVETDVEAIYNNIKSFIDLYNETIDLIYKELKEERFRDYQPLTQEEKEAMSEKEIEKWEEKARSGILRNDAILSGTASEIRLTMSQIVSGIGDVKSLSEIGIRTAPYWEDPSGKLKINEEALKAAIAKDPEAVEALFTNNSEVASETGLVRRLYDTLDKAIKRVTSEAGSAAALYDQSFLSRSIREINDDIAALEKRLEKVEARYWRQFTAMERAINTMNQQSAWLSAQMTGLTGQG